MKTFLKMCSLVSLFTIALALFPPTLHAQYVYLNDNVSTVNGNRAEGFMNVPANKLLAIAGSPWASGGTSVISTDALKDQTLYSLAGTAFECLFISEPLASTPFPNGDIAAFLVNTGTGALTYAGSFGSPTSVSGSIALATGKGVLYAGYSSPNTVVVWQISTTCGLILKNALLVHPLNGGFIDGMAEAHNSGRLVVSYDDGSIQSFKTVGFGIVPDCAVAINSTGFTDGNHSEPNGVDITKDSKYAIFGDRVGNNPPHGPTELEVVLLPIGCASITTDYGGSIVASGVNLGGFIDSTNLWLSPNEAYIYVTNNGPNPPQGFTAVSFVEPAIIGLAGIAPPCTPLHTNPTTLFVPSGVFFEPNGIQTRATNGTGTRIYVAEYRNPGPSAVGLLAVDASGCTKEFPLSPFVDLSVLGGDQLNAVPPRPF